MLYGVSPSLVPPPRDWPDYAHVCGQWLPPQTEWSPPDVLAEFLAAGEAPLYVGFGSMVGFDRQALLKEIVSAVDGRAAVQQIGDIRMFELRQDLAFHDETLEHGIRVHAAFDEF